MDLLIHCIASARVASLVQKHAINKRLSEEEIIIRIVNGGNNMPAYGGSLTTEELNYLIVFLNLNLKNELFN